MFIITLLSGVLQAHDSPKSWALLFLRQPKLFPLLFLEPTQRLLITVGGYTYLYINIQKLCGLNKSKSGFVICMYVLGRKL